MEGGGLVKRRGRRPGSKNKPVTGASAERSTAILFRFYSGEDSRAIAKDYGMELPDLWNVILGIPEARHKKARKRAGKANQSALAKGRLIAAGPRAAEAVVAVLDDPDAKTGFKLRAAEMILGAGGVPLMSLPPAAAPVLKIDQSQTTQTMTQYIGISRAELKQMLEGAVDCGLTTREKIVGIEAVPMEALPPARPPAQPEPAIPPADGHSPS